MKKKVLIGVVAAVALTVIVAAGCAAPYATSEQAMGLQNQINSLSGSLNSTQQQLTSTQQDLASTQQ